MCPFCGRDAPIVYRGALPYCTACGRPRAPLSSPSVNLAGKPSRVGGAVASIAGALVLLVGLSIALGLGLLLNALVTAAVALAVALPVAVVVLGVGIALLSGGRLLRRSGAEKERTTREQALLALTAHRGAVTAGEAARALGVSVAEADAMLTALAKREPDLVTVDVDDRGTVWYRTPSSPGEPFERRARVEENVRVATQTDAQSTTTRDGEESDVEESAREAESRR